MSTSFKHLSVLKKETVHLLIPQESEVNSLSNSDNNKLYFADVTLGAGGHTQELAKELLEINYLKNFELHFIGIDRDENAINFASKNLETTFEAHKRCQFHIFHAPFSELKHILQTNFSSIKLQGFLADFGVSSPQLDKKERGFSLVQEGPLDMRMDQSQIFDAKTLLETYNEQELTRIFFDYGEEPKARKLSRKIVADREAGLLPLESTAIFANYVARCLAYPSRSRTHPATRVFQALRIEVNGELEQIRTLLHDLPNFMKKKSKAAFISFHSLEDKLVKHALRSWQSGKKLNLSSSHRTKNETQLPLHLELHLYDNEIRTTYGKEMPRGGVTANEEEIFLNPRSRSARLRCFEFSLPDEI